MTFLIGILAMLQRFSGAMGFRVAEARARAFRLRPPSGASPESVSGKGCVWFHASSRGELEMLRPLIDDLIERKTPVAVSVFSASALSGLREIEGAVFTGFSPREDLWEAWFRHFSVRKLVLAKYDFWPGMLRAARKRAAPVVVINAEWRASLRWVLLLFRGLGESLPLLKFVVNPGERGSRDALSRRFGADAVATGMNPRFERVRRRLRQAASSGLAERIGFWRERIVKLPEPRILLGSAWEEDLVLLAGELRTLAGSLVVVPHVLQEQGLERMRAILEQSLPGRCLLIEEMGILVELYPLSDRAFVGGGFGRGIHSTLEPAVCGVPVACGPGKAESFPETRDLRSLGVLTVCRDGADIRRWLEAPVPARLREADFENLTARYQRLLEHCL